MKKIFAILALLIALSSEAQKTKRPPLASAADLKTKEDSLQYAMGIYIGKWIRDNGFTTFDAAHFLPGIEDVLKQQPKQFNDSVVASLLNGQKKTLQIAIARQLEAKMFASIVDTPGIQSLPNGIKYRIRKQGTGPQPGEKDSVVIAFKGALADGTVFEDTYSRQAGVRTTPGSLFPGLMQALLAMRNGSVWQLFIPAAMVYGDTGNGTNIPPGNAVIMLLSLVEVKKNQ